MPGRNLHTCRHLGTLASVGGDHDGGGPTMLRLVECQAVLFGCRTIAVRPEGGILTQQTTPGAEWLLARLPPGRAAIIGPDQHADTYAAVDLRPPTVVQAEVSTSSLLLAASVLRADPGDVLVLVDEPDHLRSARSADMKVIALATRHEAEALAGADLVVPSLRSVRAIGVHPLLVLEVDALPDTGRWSAGPNHPL
jgi:hypothetical protein